MSPFHDAPPQRQGETNSKKPQLSRSAQSVLISALKVPNPSVQGKLGQLVTLPAIASASSSSSFFKPQKQPCQTRACLVPTHPLLEGSGRTGQFRPSHGWPVPPGAPTFQGTGMTSCVLRRRLHPGSPGAGRCGA